MKAKLRKEVCQKCYRKYGLNWSRLLDEHWDNGRLHCIMKGRIFDGYIKTNGGYVRMEDSKGLSLDKMPDDCTYRLEHTVLGSQNGA